MEVGWGLDRILYLGKAEELMIEELNKEEKSERGEEVAFDTTTTIP